jgi:hypothetical protein
VATTQPTPKPTPRRRIAVKGRADAGSDGDKSAPKVASELWTLTVDYAKQEIKDPVKGLGTYLLWGSVSMLLVGLGMVLLAIGGLRALQTETGSTFTGSLSWAPYGIVLLGSAVMLALVAWIIVKRKAGK